MSAAQTAASVLAGAPLRRILLNSAAWHVVDTARPVRVEQVMGHQHGKSVADASNAYAAGAIIGIDLGGEDYSVMTKTHPDGQVEIVSFAPR